MDNQTATACEKCHAIVFYDKDAPEPKLCPVCQKEENNKPKDDGLGYVDINFAGF